MDLNEYEIIYIIPLEDRSKKDITPFQGFNLNLIEKYDFFKKIIELPYTIFEFSLSREITLLQHINGHANQFILPVHINSFKSSVSLLKSPFICVFSDEKTYEQVKKVYEEDNHKFLHISTVKDSSTLDFNSFTRKDLHEFCKKQFKKYFEKYPTLKNEQIFNILKKFKDLETLTINYGKKYYNSIEPNKYVLESIKGKIENSSIVKTNNTFFMEDIINLSFTLARFNIHILKMAKKENLEIVYPPLNLIISVPSIFSAYYDSQSHIDEKILKTIEKYHICNSSLNSKKDNLETFVKLRDNELVFHNLCVAIKASAHFCPSITLPFSLYNLRKELKQLGELERKDSRKISKIKECHNRIISCFEKTIDTRIVNFLDQKFISVKIFSDFPIEWMPIEGIPLMIRFETSRIPITPGNILLKQSLETKQQILTLDTFAEILIVRSFEENDPLRFVLEKGLEVAKEAKIFGSSHLFQVKIKLVDVKTKKEFINAINNFDGALMIFDGHGCHEENDKGNLIIGGEKLSVDDLYGQIKPLPIVILSACDTHPIDQNHASTANFFLNSGFITVLGSLLPINAFESTMFIARLIARIEDYVPILIKKNSMLRWTNVISGLLKMSYVTDILKTMKDYNYISETDKYKLQFKANNFINIQSNDWLEEFTSVLSQSLKLDISETKKLITKHFKITESMKYIQLGNPENIVICGKENQFVKNI